MLPTSLSASSCQVFESCPARYKASHIDKAPDLSGSAANLGSACHEVLERYVLEDHYKKPDKKIMKHLWKETYPKYFPTHDRYDEGLKLLETWFDRTDLLADGREVISAEVKTRFELKTSAGIIPFTYIWDRCDRHPDGSIEVIDYKTLSLPLQPEQLKQKIQPRAYAVAAAIQFPEATAIWVTFDMLRYDPIGIKFTREENVETWHYLQNLAEKIIASDGTEETLNPECRFCIRKTECETLNSHTSVGGVLAVDNINAAVDRRAKLDFIKGGIDAQIKDLDAFILDAAEKEEITEFLTDEMKLEISVGSRRVVDSERVAKIMGAEFMAENGTVTVSSIDAILKDKQISAETKSQLRSIIQRKFNRPTIKTTPLTSFGDD